MTVDIRILTAQAARAERDGLSEILVDCVHGGASVGFILPFAKADSDVFWDGVINSIAADQTLLFAGYVDGVLCGTVQLQLVGKPNQPHRAEIAKMLVHRAARRHGLGARLLAAAEAEARTRQRWLLVLDTVTDSAGHHLYAATGWTAAGEIPNYALMPDGALCPTTYFYKDLR